MQSLDLLGQRDRGRHDDCKGDLPGFGGHHNSGHAYHTFEARVKSAVCLRPQRSRHGDGECHDGQGGTRGFCRGHDRTDSLRLHLHAEANEKAAE